MNTRRALLALLTGTALAPSALACNIAEERGSLQGQVLRAHNDASVVVLAKVVDARFQGAPTSPFGESPSHHAKLEVMETWKGKHKPGDHIATIASTRPDACALVLTPGETYLLYLRNKEPYDVSWSRRNARLDDASQDVQVLRRAIAELGS